MASFRPTSVKDINSFGKAIEDMGTKLDALFSKETPEWMQSFGQANSKVKDLGLALDHLKDGLSGLASGSEEWKQQNKWIEAFGKELKKTEKAINPLTLGVKAAASAFDKLGKGILSIGFGTFLDGAQSLQKAVHKIWDVMERATKVAGEFTMKIGSMSPNMGAARKQMGAWEGTIRGLTDAQGVGSQMFGDYLLAFDRMIADTKDGNTFSKMMLGLARGFNLGGEGAGHFAKMMSNLATEEVFDPKNAQHLSNLKEKTAETFKEVTFAAKEADAPVNQFFQQFVKAKSWIAEYGSQGVKTITKTMVYAKKLGVSLESLKKWQDATDTFDDTAKSMAKLNTVFGTSINAMDVMLEQDPSKRFEIIRKSMLNQGKTFENLSRMERKIIAEQTGLSMEEVQGFLKSGDTLEEYETKREKAQKSKIDAEAQIRKAMQQTATTMFAFKDAWDKVWIAVTKLIKPFTDVLGLTNSGEKGAKSFSQVMDGLFKRLIKFINEVAANKDWQGFMKRLANDAVNLAKRISAFATGPGLGDWIKTIVKAGGDFYDIMKLAFGIIVEVGKKAMPVVKFIAENITTILAGWGAMKIAGAGMGAAGALGGAGMAGIGGAIGSAGMAVAGGAAGYMGGSALSKKMNKQDTKEGDIGALAGGGVGAVVGALLGGPFGAALGAGIGAASGKIIGDYFYTNEKLAKSNLQLSAALQVRKDAENENNNILKSITDAQIVRDLKRSRIEEGMNTILDKVKKEKINEIEIEGEAKKQYQDRLKELELFGSKNKDVADLLKRFSDTNGPVNLTAKELMSIKTESEKLAESLRKLTDQTNISTKEAEKRENTEFKLKDASIKAEISQRQTLIDNIQNQLKGDEIDKKTKEDNIKLQKKQAQLIEAINDKDEFKQKVLRMDIEDIFKAPSRRRKSLEEQLNNEKELQNKSNIELTRNATQHQDRLFAIQLRSQIMSSTEYGKFALSNKELGPEEMMGKFLDSELGKQMVPQNLRKTITTANDLAGAGYRPKAAGGIFTSPTRALIGEAGPEAVLPLKALVSGGDSLSSNAIGAQVAGEMANLAAGRATSSTSGTREVSTEISIYLDSTIVGRAVSKQMLENYDI